MTMSDPSNLNDYVTFSTAGQMFGLAIERVHVVCDERTLSHVCGGDHPYKDGAGGIWLE